VKQRLVLVASLALLSSLGCNRQRFGGEQPPPPESEIPGLLDPVRAYHEMGFLAAGAPVSFVGSVRFLAGPTPDSTLVLFSLSLANNALRFQRSGSSFQASYHVQVAIRSAASTRDIASDETARVPALAETLGSEDNVIFQRFILLPPGDAVVRVSVADRATGSASQDERAVRVPRFEASRGASVVPAYRAEGRSNRHATPDLISNPRATAAFWSDTLSLYVEAYGAPEGAVTLRAVDESQNEVWRATPEMPGDSAMRRGMVQIPPGVLPPGRLRIEGLMPGSDTARTPVLVSYADQWVVADFDGVLGLLRYFRADEAIRQMKTAPAAGRAALWRAFWHDTDSIPQTPESETLTRYFSRLRSANAWFREGAQPGWLTDRGEVLVALGEPDQEFPIGAAPGVAPPRSCRVQACPSVG